jgi:poly-beta-1,6-N-acetyl-D-glucosamine N-deacetylase
MAGLRRECSLALVGLVGCLLQKLGAVERARQRILGGGCVACIAFHDPKPPVFERCVIWLRDAGFTFISADDLIAIARNGSTPPRGSVWISLDDGWRGNLDLVPVIDRYRVPVTIFLATEAVGPLGLFWWTCIYDHRSELPPPFRSRPRLLWSLPEGQRKKLTEPVVSRHNAQYERQALSIEDVRALSRNQLISFGSHTVHHPSLPNCDATQLDEELAVSKRQIEGWTDRPVGLFAYPGGRCDGREEDALARNGYELAVTTTGRVYRPGADSAYFVPRLEVGDGSRPSADACKMVGAWIPYVDWARKIRAAIFG